MKKILCSLLACASISAFASVGDVVKLSPIYNSKKASSYGFIYISNTSNQPVLLSSFNAPNSNGFSKFNCLIPIPKNDQHGINSPAFQTYMSASGNSSAAGSIIKKGQTISYAFDPDCNQLWKNDEGIAISKINDDGSFGKANFAYNLYITDGTLDVTNMVNWPEIFNSFLSTSMNNSRSVFLTITPHQ